MGTSLARTPEGDLQAKPQEELHLRLVEGDELSAYMKDQREVAKEVLRNPELHAPKQASPESNFLPDSPHTSFAVPGDPYAKPTFADDPWPEYNK